MMNSDAQDNVCSEEKIKSSSFILGCMSLSAISV